MKEAIPAESVISLSGRERLTVTGVQEVLRFEECGILLQTSLGRLTVLGQELKLRTLEPQGGQIHVEGHFDSMSYEEAPRRRRIFG